MSIPHLPKWPLPSSSSKKQEQANSLITKTYVLDGLELPVEIRRNRRARRITLSIDAQTGTPQLVIPRGTSYAEALKFLHRESDWILNKIDELPPRVLFEDGAGVPLLGRKCRIRHLPLLPPEVCREGDELVVGGRDKDVKYRVTEWLTNAALQKLTELAQQKMRSLGRSSAKVSVRDPKTRWGSCSEQGYLSFSWRLILAPPSVMDYVVAHEVAHLNEFDHGPNFWLLVERLCPRHRMPKHWLTRHGAKLLRYG